MTDPDGHTHNVVIVGAGMVGSLLASKLAEANVSDVVVLDAGPQAYFDWSPETGQNSAFTDQRAALFQTYFANQVKMDNSPFTDLAYAPSPMVDSDTTYFDQQPSGDNQQLFDSTYMRMAGGTSYHWLGVAIRMLPNDFTLKTTYGRGIDWPITYNDLEPWYYAAECELGVAGDDATAGLAWRGNKPYPMPPIPQSNVDRTAIAAVASSRYAGQPLKITPVPVARNSVPYDGRPACAGSTNCVPLCPIQAKYDSSVHLKRALGAPDVHGVRFTTPVQLRLGALVTQVVVDTTSGLVDHLEYIDAMNGLERKQIRARRYIIAAHAVETAKILLLSNKVANTSGQVGLNLMDHPCQLTYARTDPVHPFRGPITTSTIDTFRDGPSRANQAAIRGEFQNVGYQWMTGSPTGTVYDDVVAGLASGQIGQGLAAQIQDDLSREVIIDCLLEQLPDPNNRVILSSEPDPFGIPRPQLHWSVDQYTLDGAEFARKTSTQILVAMGADPSKVTPQAGAQYKLYGAGHQHGTHVMGTDPCKSVTDSYGVTHDHANLSLIGCGSFPTIGTANPTLTLMALTLRSAEQLVRGLQDRVVTSP